MTSKSTKAALALAPILSAALIGASLQLIFYPQVVFGVVLLVLGTCMKLYSSLVGILLLAILVPSLLGLVFLLHTRLQHGLPHAVKTVLLRLGPKILLLVRQIPPSVIVMLAFALPALGQVNSTFSMVRMLVQVGAENSAFTISLFSAASALLTVLVQVFGVLNSAYMTPGKICFLLNSIWIVKSIIVDGNTRPGGKSIFPFMTTMVLGWSSLILGSLPDKAVLNASQAALKAAMVSAAVAGGGVAVVAVVANHNSASTSSVEQVVEVMASSVEAEGEAEVTVVRKQEFLDNLVRWITEQMDRLQVTSKLREAKLRVQAAAEETTQRVVETSDLAFQRLNEELAEEQSPSSSLPPPQEEEAAAAVPVENPAVAFLKEINPPVPVALAIAVLRAVPTLIVFLLVELLGVYNVVVRKESPRNIFFPATLLPFVLAELFALVKRGGLKRGAGAIFRATVSDTDGMSILLWQSPKLLAVWNQFKQADKRIGEIAQTAFASPKSLLFPSEEYIAEAPNADRDVFVKLFVSFLIDVIGVTTFAIPGLGESFDVIWAPVSAFIIQNMYGSPGFAFMGFAEELLPFTDVVPTATIAWFWLFAQEIPVWVIRIVRTAKEASAKGKKKAE